MAPASLPRLTVLFLFLLFSFTTADDAAVMSKLARAITPAPASWTGTAFCKWSGVHCDGNGRVTSINLNTMSLSGTLPSNLNSLSQLTSLSLQGNHFSGELPSLVNLSNLQNVYLNNNNFSSIAEGAFSGLSSLQTLSLSSNVDLAPWKFPSELSQSTGLVTLYAGSCNLIGSIPDIFGSFPGLQNLRLSFNGLTGSLPSSFAGSEIQNLWLNVNTQDGSGLTGSIGVIGTMTQLTQVWLNGNSFTGAIPDLSNCTSIFDLQLSDNQLTGVVPQSLIDLPKLANISLQNNHLQGPYPDFKSGVTAELGIANSFCTDEPGVACEVQVTALIAVAGAFGYPKMLADSWQGNSACNQWPYVSCDSSGYVAFVSLGKQHLNGSISPVFADLKVLQRLYLNDNNLTGTIPEYLTSLTNLQTLDVSNNNITGVVPTFRAGVTVNSKGNPFIGSVINTGGGRSSGSNSSGSGGGSGRSSPKSSQSAFQIRSSPKSSQSAFQVVGVVIGVIATVGGVLFIMCKCYLRRRYRKIAKAKELDFGGQMAFKIEVIRQVTNNFSDENILGRGGFGVVYKGELQEGTKIAVKRMKASAMGTIGMNAFQAEIGVLTKVRHRHLVALLGYCVTDTERLLVYEYMPQGTLAQRLFEWREIGCRPLEWEQRVTIALDVARGVEYLHSLAQSSFIHRDLKPTNILLGDDMRAKVADFGLVRTIADSKCSLWTDVAGTFGYLAPEYGATGRATTKVDVYAFGVILMELLTGRRALEETMPEERLHLVTWFRGILIDNEEDIREAIDEALDADDETFERILRVAELAGHCTAHSSHQRPDIGHVVTALSPLVEQWRPAASQGEGDDEESYCIDLHSSSPQAHSW